MKSRRIALAVLALGGSLAVLCGTAPPVQAQTIEDQELVAEEAHTRLLNLPATPAVPHLDPDKITQAMLKPDYRNFTFVIAHRGSHSAPEMTEHAPAGIQAAYDAGADGIELDVKTTTDGFVVLGHDLAIGRELASWSGAPPTPWTPFQDYPLVDPAYAQLTRWPFLINKDADSPDNPNRTKSPMSKIWRMPLRDTFGRQVADTQMTLYEALYLIQKYYPMQVWLDVKDLADLVKVGDVIRQARARFCSDGVCTDGPLKNICLKLSWGTAKQLVDSQGVFVGPRGRLNQTGIYYFLAFGTGDLDDMATRAAGSTPAERVRNAVDTYCSISLGCLGGEPAHKYPGAPTQDIFDYLKQLRARTTDRVLQLASFHSVPQYDWYWSGLGDKARSLTYGRWYTRGDGSCCYSFNDTLNASPLFGPEYQDLRPSYSWNETNNSTITTDEPLLVLRELYRKGKRDRSLARALLARGSSDIPSGGDTATDVGSLADGLYKLLTTNTRLPMGIVTGTLLIVDSGNPSALWYVATRPGKKYTIVNALTGKGLYSSNDEQVLLKSPVTSDQRFLWESASDGSWKPAGSSMGLFYGQGSRATAVTLSRPGSQWSTAKVAAGVSERDPASSDSGPRGYTFCADEGGTCQFTSRASVALGANGSFRYFDVTGPYNCSLSSSDPEDPAPGVVKACYFAPSTDDGFPGRIYQTTACADESSSCTVARNQSLAFGVQTANGWRFTYQSFDTAGTIPCTVERFGFDPAPGLPKRCYLSLFPGGDTPSGPPGFALCAMRNDTCSFVGTGAVAIGLSGRYTYKTATNGVPCTTASFGLDPTPGAFSNTACFYRQTAQPILSYVKCADEDQGCTSKCTVPGSRAFRVIFGAKGRYEADTFLGPVDCCQRSFHDRDPIVGERKACYASRLDLVYCAAENGHCYVPSAAIMMFGAPADSAGQTWQYTTRRVLAGDHDCNTQTFGDPAPQKAKACFYQLLDIPQRGPETFTYCADQEGTCQIGNSVAQIAFGVDGQYTYAPFQVGTFQCTKDGLKIPDPAPLSRKGCYYRLY